MDIDRVRLSFSVGKVWVKPLSHWAVFALLQNGDEEFLGYYPNREKAEEAEAVAREAGWQFAQEAWVAAQALHEDRIEYPHDAREVGRLVSKRGQTYRCASIGDEADAWVTHCAYCGVRFAFDAPLVRDGKPELAFRARMYCETHQAHWFGFSFRMPPHPKSISREWEL